MHLLPTEWTALYGLVFLLGIRHGLDADHLATIDGLTRLNGTAGRRFARWCGALFSLGHGAVVLAVALLVAGTRQHGPAPQWLDGAGAATSIGFLLVLGAANLHQALTAAPGTVVAPVGLKGRLLGPLRRARHPLAVAAVGALFALSFDTVSQVALFAFSAVPSGGAVHAALLGATFTAGMLTVDAANGLWVARLLSRADEAAARASRTMGISVGAVSLLAAACGIARWFGVHEAGPPWLFGAVVVGVVFASYGVACRVGVTPRAPGPAVATEPAA